MMVMLVIMVLGFAALLVKSLSSADIRNERQAQTSAALAQAKEALIGYAITYGDMPGHIGEVHGYLPCPDLNGGNPEGTAEPVCGAKDVSQIGRLPWRTLVLAPLRDGDGECLWYAVSGTYKNNPKTGLMNWDTNGQLQAYAMDGTRLDSNNNQVVAVIFGPGTAQDGEDRSGNTAPTCGGNYNAANYLDNDTVHNINNADIATGKFIQGERNGLVNDNMVFITRQDLWNAMLKRSDFADTLDRLTKRTAECLADYGKHNDNLLIADPNKNKSLPRPALRVLADYGLNSNYDDTLNNASSPYYSRYSGRIPYSIGFSNSQTGNTTMVGDLLIVDEPPIGNPPRPLNGLACPTYSAAPTSELQLLYPWWKNWKDHLFYALSREYRPDNDPTGPCGDCVKVDGSATGYAAIVMFGGSALSGVNRASTTTNNAERSVLSNYLEVANATNHPNAGGDSTYRTDPAGPAFNDVLYCIRTDLSVIPCP
ncbi:MAG: hypothetical protein HZB47_01670 [Nitrosomonadales bacterium]|nr:hypothetical protein [Nitrosomonadales bacterium]